jgi:hypothetical protein
VKPSEPLLSHGSGASQRLEVNVFLSLYEEATLAQSTALDTGDFDAVERLHKQKMELLRRVDISRLGGRGNAGDAADRFEDLLRAEKMSLESVTAALDRVKRDWAGEGEARRRLQSVRDAYAGTDVDDGFYARG